MRNRLELIAKGACAALALMLVAQLPGAFTGGIDPAQLKIPAPPKLEEESGKKPEPKPAPGAPVGVPSPVPTAGAPVPASGPPGMSMPPGMPMMMRPGMPGMPTGMPGGPGGPRVPLPPEVQARVDFIIKSELLGPVPRPMPMALLGIAGNDVFLRAPNGQTGLVSEGNEFGGVKILQIGTNRALVEHEGKKQELMLHSGYGGESLMPKE